MVANSLHSAFPLLGGGPVFIPPCEYPQLLGTELEIFWKRVSGLLLGWGRGVRRRDSRSLEGEIGAGRLDG